VTALGVAIVTAVVSAVLGGAATYFAARRDLQLKFDDSLRDLRIGAYKDLWQKLELLAKYGRPNPLAKSEAQGLRDDLRNWYFRTGGLVLSTQTRQDYFALLDALELVIVASDKTVGGRDDEFLRVLGSRLRTAMTRDVGTRRTFVFRGDEERDPSPIKSGTYVEQGGTARLVVSATRRLDFRRRPRFELPYAGQGLSWDAARRELVARVPAQGKEAEDRLFILEGEQIVEGPKGWERGEERRRGASRIWERNDD
jgi:hypothetical protein